MGFITGFYFALEKKDKKIHYVEHLKVAQNTLEKFLKSAENFLIMIDSTMDKKYVGQMGKKLGNSG